MALNLTPEMLDAITGDFTETLSIPEMIYEFPKIYGPFRCDTSACDNETQLCIIKEPIEQQMVRDTRKAAIILMRRLGTMRCGDCAARNNVRMNDDSMPIGVIAGNYEQFNYFMNRHINLNHTNQARGHEFSRIILTGTYWQNNIYKEKTEFAMIDQNSLAHVSMEIMADDPIKIYYGNLEVFLDKHRALVERHSIRII